MVSLLENAEVNGESQPLLWNPGRGQKAERKGNRKWEARDAGIYGK